MGAHAKPGHLHIKEGTFRPGRHTGQADVMMTPAKPSPVGMKVPDDSLWLWEDITEQLPIEVQSKLDRAALSMLCRQWSLWNTIQSELEAAVADLKPDEFYKLQCAATMAYKPIKDLFGKFGMTPLDRPRLKAGKPSEEGDALGALGAINAE
jgi:hypothetical protein